MRLTLKRRRTREYSYPQAGKAKRPRYIKRVILLALFAVIGLAIWLAIRNLNAPAEGSISQTPPAKKEVIDPYANPGTYQSKYISFGYPADYKKANSVLSGNYLEVIDLASTSGNTRHITVSVQKQNLASYSGYTYRIQHPELYHKEPTTQYGQAFTALGSADSERTAFAQHGDLLATVAVTGPGQQDLSSDSIAVLDSLAWK